MFPKTFQKLIDNFSALPSVGNKMAERLVLFLFRQDKEFLEDFSKNLSGIKDLKICQKCFNISEKDLCEICQNPHREKKVICVVEDALDIISIEKIGLYKGLYHVLGGTIENSNNNEKSDLKITQLLDRVKNEKIQEVITAFNPTAEGDLTTLYLKRKLQPLKVKITRLARGLSTGGDIEYADEATLSNALTNRKEML
jgi:recombination protein RecR